MLTASVVNTCLQFNRSQKKNQKKKTEKKKKNEDPLQLLKQFQYLSLAFSFSFFFSFGIKLADIIGFGSPIDLDCIALILQITTVKVSSCMVFKSGLC